MNRLKDQQPNTGNRESEILKKEKKK